MPMIRCAADEHYYDPSDHDECPYCRKTRYLKTPDFARHQETPVAPIPQPRRDSTKTRVIFGGRSDAQSGEAVAPAVGWLVVLNGRGKGRDFRLVPGMNRIGRDRDMHVCLDVGDETISRREHALVFYDPLNKTYFVQHGNGQNLTYLNGAAVIGGQPLKDRDRLRIGRTELLFVALCGEAFDWE